MGQLFDGKMDVDKSEVLMVGIMRVLAGVCMGLCGLFTPGVQVGSQVVRRVATCISNMSKVETVQTYFLICLLLHGDKANSVKKSAHCSDKHILLYST